MDDRSYMQLALELAEKGRGFTSPNPMVGAVIVKSGRIVGRGYHREVGGAHAEVEALKDAGAAADGGTIYVTLEPCNHEGRTPPCTEAILKAGIKRVVMAMADPNPDVAGGGANYLRQQAVKVESGLCAVEARRQNEVFVKYIRTKQPFVLLKCAATLDGRIATRSGDAKWVTGAAARQRVHSLRHWLDAILVGIGTVKADNPRLTTRLPNGVGRNPTRIVLDSKLAIPENACLLAPTGEAEAVIVTGPLPDQPAVRAKRERIETTGARVIEAPLSDGRIDWPWLVRELGARGITGVLVEGGGQIIGSAIKAGVADKIAWFFAPKIMGGNDGVPVCAGRGPETMADCLAVNDLTVQRVGDDILFEGYPAKPQANPVSN